MSFVLLPFGWQLYLSRNGRSATTATVVGVVSGAFDVIQSTLALCSDPRLVTTDDFRHTQQAVTLVKIHAAV